MFLVMREGVFDIASNMYVYFGGERLTIKERGANGLSRTLFTEYPASLGLS